MPMQVLKSDRAAADLMCLMVAGLAAPPVRADNHDLAHLILACFHPTGRYMSHRSPGDWPKAGSYGADDSEIFDIDFKGSSGKEYTITVAFMVRIVGRQMQYRGELLSDSSVVPANANCRLNDWSSDEE